MFRHDRAYERVFIMGIILSATLWLAACSGQIAGKPVTDAPLFEGQSELLEKSASWLLLQRQNEDGGFTSFSTGVDQGSSDVGGTLDAILALSAAGIRLADTISEDEKNPIVYLQRHIDRVKTYATENGAQAGKLVLALAAAGINPRDFQGLDTVGLLIEQLDDSGSYSVEDSFKQSLALLGLAAAGETAPEEAVQWLVNRQADNGSWDDGFGTVDNPDATAMAIMALLASGLTGTDSILVRATEFLRNAQEPDGGWGYAPGFGMSANSTALVIQALSALDENWYSAEGNWVKDGRTPLDALRSFQSGNGAFQADLGQGLVDDFFTTIQSIPALAGEPYPIEAE